MDDPRLLERQRALALHAVLRFVERRNQLRVSFKGRTLLYPSYRSMLAAMGADAYRRLMDQTPANV